MAGESGSLRDLVMVPYRIGLEVLFVVALVVWIAFWLNLLRIHFTIGGELSRQLLVVVLVLVFIVPALVGWFLRFRKLYL